MMVGWRNVCVVMLPHTRQYQHRESSPIKKVKEMPSMSPASLVRCFIGTATAPHHTIAVPVIVCIVKRHHRLYDPFVNGDLVPART